MAGQDAKIVISGKGTLIARAVAVSYNYQARAQNTAPEHSSDIDFQLLTNELGRLRRAMMQEAIASEGAEQPDQAIAVANAEKSAKAGDSPATLNHLKSAGQWAWDSNKNWRIGRGVTPLHSALGR